MNVQSIYLALSMLFLQSISLFQFKNYTQRSFDFSERVISICGNNGTGKTNLLDAIHYLCFTKSYFTRADINCVQQGKSGFRLEGDFRLQDKSEKAVCILRENGKKEFSINDEAYEKFSRHIGHYPCVVIAPDDASLITGVSEERRRFLDSMLSQLYAEYLQHLIIYTRVLQQRNSLLKAFTETGAKNFTLLDVIDQQLIKPGEYIFNKQKEFLISFLPMVKHLYLDIAKRQEDIQLVYESELLHASIEELLQVTRQKDCIMQRTTSGIHRDNVEINLGSLPFRTIASQGQRKSLLFALKLAEMEVLKMEKGFPPLLLLDDVFEKLDEERISNLLQKVCRENEGQILITDTNEERLVSHLKQIAVAFQLINL